MTFSEIGVKAKAASAVLRTADAAAKNAALLAIAAALRNRTQEILDANQTDLSRAAENGVRDVMVDRLRLTPARIEAMAKGVEEVAAAPDPVGEVLSMQTRPNGLVIGRKRVPLGVVGIIFEARPNVTVDAAALCLKSGNACILRGGREALHSNLYLAELMRSAVAEAGLPADSIHLLHDTSREGAQAMMEARGVLDVLIPRGGAGLIRSVVEQAKVPVIETGVGNCHIYVEQTADLAMACDIVFNAKTSRPSVCNAAESLLVDRAIAPKALPLLKARLEEKNVTLYACPEARSILGDSVFPATEEDYGKEYLDYAMSVKVVAGPEEAVAHINRYGTGHSEAIITSDYFVAQQFLNEIDAAAVYVNASTRFTDGGEFGVGAEIGISTQKLHARGPMGAEALTSTKFIVYGSGQTR